MESPAIITAMLLSTYVRNKQSQLAVVGGAASPGDDEDDGEGTDTDDDAGPSPLSLKKVLHEALTDGSALLLLGSVLAPILRCLLPAPIGRVVPYKFISVPPLFWHLWSQRDFPPLYAAMRSPGGSSV
jgi:hypothetical protein